MPALLCSASISRLLTALPGADISGDEGAARSTGGGGGGGVPLIVVCAEADIIGNEADGVLLCEGTASEERGAGARGDRIES